MRATQREIIIKTFAAWTALSAIRSGSPVKSRKDVYPLVSMIPFGQILSGDTPIHQDEFNQWHHDTAKLLCDQDRRLCTGWAVKIINVYLKTAAYVGNLGRPNLRAVIHPPIDGGLWESIEGRYRQTHPEIIKMTHKVSNIKSITDYNTYACIIDGCRLVAKELNCTLIEVEQLWDTTPKQLKSNNLNQLAASSVALPTL